MHQDTGLLLMMQVVKSTLNPYIICPLSCEARNPEMLLR